MNALAPLTLIAATAAAPPFFAPPANHFAQARCSVPGTFELPQGINPDATLIVIPSPDGGGVNFAFSDGEPEISVDADGDVRYTMTIELIDFGGDDSELVDCWIRSLRWLLP